MQDTPTKRPVGRPPLYRDEYAEEMLAFFDPEKAKPTVIDGVVLPPTLPLISAFAWKLGVSRETLHEWATLKDALGNLRYPDFAYAYARAKCAQEIILSANGLSGAYNPTFAILTAKNILGWRDKQETAHTGPDGGAVRVMQVTGDEAKL